MEIKGTEMDSIEKYLELSRTCTELFAQSEELPLVLDPKELYAFAQKSGRRIGIVYESHYHLMVVDVVRAKNGSLFAYERLMNRVMTQVQLGGAALRAVPGGREPRPL